MAVALASQLREGTKAAHTMAENTGFVSCFLKGVVDRSSYRILVAAIRKVLFGFFTRRQRGSSTEDAVV